MRGGLERDGGTRGQGAPIRSRRGSRRSTSWQAIPAMRWYIPRSGRHCIWRAAGSAGYCARHSRIRTAHPSQPRRGGASRGRLPFATRLHRPPTRRGGGSFRVRERDLVSVCSRRRSLCIFHVVRRLEWSDFLKPAVSEVSHGSAIGIPSTAVAIRGRGRSLRTPHWGRQPTASLDLSRSVWNS